MIKVLIVEDDPMVIKLNKFYLKQMEGFEFKAEARSVDEALSILETQDIDLILLDIFMPGVDGLQLLSLIRKLDKNIDVIVVSAARDSLSIKKALQLGAVDYLIKPFEFERFSAALSSYRNRETLINKKDALSQEDLDKLVLYKNKEKAVAFSELPKGLDRNTLKMVWGKILELKDISFSTEEAANLSGISRVSMRKYLLFLNDIGVLKKEVIYGSLGRPIYKYKFEKSNSYIIKNYL